MGYKKANFQPIKLSTLACLLIQLSSPSYAGDKENHIINKAIEAYGGDKLIQLKNLQYTDNMHHFFEMQSGHNLQGPMTTQLNNYQLEITIDFVNEKKEFKRATTKLVGNHDSENLTTTHQTFFNGKGYKIDHCLQEFQQLNYINYDNVDLGYSQMLDTLIIKQLAEDKENATWVDIAYIQGQPHDVLTINKGAKNEYSLYLNQETGHLSRMLKKRGQQLRSYDFIDHHQTQGLTWAKQMFVGTSKQPIYFTNNRQLKVNQSENVLFELPTNYRQQQQHKMVDDAELTIRELAKGVYFVGQMWGYTLFIDGGDHFVSAGAWGMENNAQAWQNALTLLQDTADTDKPVALHLVTHHHTDHMAGLNSIVKHGANLIAHPTDIPAIQKHLAQQLKAERFMPINEPSYLADGKILIFDVPNSHASHNLVIYMPEYKLLFTEDMFGSSYQTAFDSLNEWPTSDTYQRLSTLTKKLEQMNLPVEQYVSSHHARILSQSDIDKAQSLSCPNQENLVNRLLPNSST